MRLLLVMWRRSKADLRLLWFALKHPMRPGWLLPAAVALGLYAIAPWNVAIPALGIADELVLVPLLLHALLKLLPAQVQDGFQKRQPGTTYGVRRRRDVKVVIS